MQMADSSTGSSVSTVPWTENPEPRGFVPWSVYESWMRSRPAGGFVLVLPDERSQLKLKPNDAAPLNTAPSGASCPPPRPVHADSATRTMPRSPIATERRAERGASRFITGPSNPWGVRRGKTNI